MTTDRPEPFDTARDFTGSAHIVGFPDGFKEECVRKRDDSASPAPRFVHRLRLARRLSVCAGVGILLFLGLSACSGSTRGLLSERATLTQTSRDPLTVGSLSTPENQTIADIYAGALKAVGFSVHRVNTAGSVEEGFRQLRQGTIDFLPLRTGEALAFLDPENAAARDHNAQELVKNKIAGENLELFNPTHIESKKVVAVTKVTAQRFSLSSIPDLAKVCEKVVVSTPQYYATSVQSMQDDYACFPHKLLETPDSASSTMQLLRDEAQVAVMTNTDPAIVDNDLVVLEDPQGWAASETWVPLGVRTKFPQESKKVMNDISDLLGNDDMTFLKREVSSENRPSSATVAHWWLAMKHLVRP